jgi:hypothetical protein
VLHRTDISIEDFCTCTRVPVETSAYTWEYNMDRHVHVKKNELIGCTIDPNFLSFSAVLFLLVGH